MLKITTLIENELSRDENLNAEHGISLYIEVDDKKILFDTGQSGNFIKNAERLNIDLKDLDYVIISHSHYDHSGGFKNLVEEYDTNFKLFIGEDFFKEKHSLSGDIYRYVGSPFKIDYLKEKDIETEYIKDIKQLTENSLIITDFIRNPEYENTNEAMFIKEGKDFVLDDFADEIALVIDTDKGLVVTVGCSHPGIVNMLDTIIKSTGKDIYALIGGTHLMKEDDEKINKIIDYLKEKEIKQIGACHCTGKQGETMLSQQMEEEFFSNNTGDILKYKL